MFWCVRCSAERSKTCNVLNCCRHHLYSVFGLPLRYKLSLGDFRICCQSQKGLATRARVLKVSRRRFMQFLQHTNREDAMRNIAVVTSVEKQNHLKGKLWKLVRKREREEQKRALQAGRDKLTCARRTVTDFGLVQACADAFGFFHVFRSAACLWTCWRFFRYLLMC